VMTVYINPFAMDSMNGIHQKIKKRSVLQLLSEFAAKAISKLIKTYHLRDSGLRERMEFVNSYMYCFHRRSETMDVSQTLPKVEIFCLVNTANSNVIHIFIFVLNT
ncbi:hypothetical protein L9F63_018930, partial [Diploptera punctata]